MNLKTRIADNSSKKRLIIQFSSLSLIALSLLTTLLWQFYAQSERNILLIEETQVIHVAERVLHEDLATVISDLRLLSHNERFEQFINATNKTEPSSLLRLMKQFSTHRGIYDQIRYIDENGQEIIRINLQHGEAVNTPIGKLQNKAHRNYFKETIKLSADEIFISKMGLNREQGILERPFKPVIRFATPIYSITGEARGILILNYLADELLQRVKQQFEFSNGEAMLINNDGYWLLYDNKREWGFERNHNELTLAIASPDEWNTITSQQHGSIDNSDGSILNFTTSYPLNSVQQIARGTNKLHISAEAGLQSHRWIIATRIPATNLPSFLNSRAVLIYLLLVIITLIVSIYVAVILARNRSAQDDRLASRKMLQTVLDTIPVRVFWKDQECRYLGCNTLFAQDAGLDSAKQIIGKTDFDMPWKGQAEIYRIDDKNVMAEGKGKLGYEEQQTAANGETLWLEISKIPLTDLAKNTYGVLGTYHEITERKEAEKSLILAREDAERANHAKSAFLSSMSHELRTPLNSILGFAQLLKLDEDLLNEVQFDSVEHILSGGQHLLTLINEVLDLSRIESGRITLSIEPVRSQEIVQECIELITPLAKKRGITVSNDLDSDSCLAVFADRTRFKQVLMNLISNAVKYNRRNGRVTLLCQTAENRRVRIGIRDTGGGIPKEQIDDLFQPFNRLNAENSQIEGTGIGLSITRNLLELMGGSISVESTVGQGSTFWIELPCGAEELKTTLEREGVSANIIQGDIQIKNQSLQVLYIEDNPSNVQLIQRLIARYPGVDMESAADASLGLELADAHQPDLILMDINLPGMNGYEALTHLRANPHTREIPVIAISANAMPHDIKRGKAAGFVDYLTKPINVELFLKTIEANLIGTDQ